MEGWSHSIGNKKGRLLYFFPAANKGEFQYVSVNNFLLEDTVTGYSLAEGTEKPSGRTVL